MRWLNRKIDELSRAEAWTYRASPLSAAEPAAWAAIALARHGRQASERPAHWLAELQQPGGAVGVSEAEEGPCWPTSLAILAWCAVNQAAGDNRFARHIESAVQWSLRNHGKTGHRSPQMGHDPTITGWSWAANTHSWLEPTCFFVLGLRAAGFGGHARVREAVTLVVDRLLPTGGANYGNTIVLGQQLLPHVQPTGVAMLALSGLSVSDARVGMSLDYLSESVSAQTAPASMAFGCLGLGANHRWPTDAETWIEATLSRPQTRSLAVYEQSLLLLAARREDSFTSLLSQEGLP